MASFVFFIVTTFQIWAYHVTCVYKLAKNFISQVTLLKFRKSTKYELDTCTGSRVIKNFVLGGLKGPPGGIGLMLSIDDSISGLWSNSQVVRYHIFFACTSLNK